MKKKKNSKYEREPLSFGVTCVRSKCYIVNNKISLI
jgi:hypothetical protein